MGAALMVGRAVLVALLAALMFSGGAAAASSSLYSGPGPRPGPAILYAPAAHAPQLDSAGIWNAPPILVSGASAYRGGEFLYQDYLYDDHGANGGQRDQNDPRNPAGSTSNDQFSVPNGTYTYPTDPVYAGDAADLVELRARPLPEATAFRITLNTLKDPSLIGIGIAIGNSALPHPFPHGANVSAPAAMFLTVHGTSAELVDATTGQAVAGGQPSVSIDKVRRQIEVRVPHSAWNPGTSTVRLAAGIGLWDKTAGKYLLPQQNADSTHPGGAGTLSNPAAFFNVAFRYAEPLPKTSDLNSDLADVAWWRDHDQGHALAAGDIGQFHADVSFSKLASHADDDMPDKPTGVPQSGPIDRILASHFETAQGTDYSHHCDDTIPADNVCKGEIQGQLQPYAIYVPKKAAPPGGYGLTLLVHSHTANYNQFLGSRNQSQFGERGPGSIVITPEGRGFDGWTWDYASADAFEVWADVARRYRLDPDYTDVAGYSMGGYSTYKLAVEYPDLFARAQPTVGPPGVGSWTGQGAPSGGEWTNTYNQLESLRNIPLLIWVAASDELVPYSGTQTQRARLDSLGLRYEFDTFAPAEHLTLAFNDQFQPAADFLGTTLVDRNPPHVSYVVNPRMQFAKTDAPADHAYWLYGMRVRNGAGAAPLGKVDVRSEGFGMGDAAPSGTQAGDGTLTGGTLPALGFQSLAQTWGSIPKAPRRDRLDVTASNLRTVSVDAKRAQVSCNAFLHVTTDGPVTVNLPSCGESVAFAKSGSSPGACRDRRTPRVRVKSVRRGTHRISLRGVASDRGCAAKGLLRARKGHVSRVVVSVALRKGKRCRFLRANGKLTKARSCRSAVLLRAKGTRRWSLSKKTRLPHGRYVVRPHAVDAAGNRSRGVKVKRVRL